MQIQRLSFQILHEMFKGFFLLLLLLIILIVLIGSRKESSKYSPPESDEIAFARQLGYRIENLSTITYMDLGQMGRMGNQLFEIAATIAIAKQNRCRVVFPEKIKELPLYNIFQLKLPLRSGLTADQTLPETSNFDHILIPSDGRVYSLEGYRQSIKYLKPIQDQLRSIFQLKLKKQNCISIHIRRTDCIKTNPIQRFFDIPLNCSLEYYRAAIKRLRKIHHLPRDYPVIVVTDDRTWAQEHLSEIDPVAKLSSEGTLNDDFLTLASARYLVISNSTFSLWGGLLGRAKEIVGPSLWFHPDNKLVKMIGSDRQHLCPVEWLFHDPITGKAVDKSYHWPDDTPGKAKKLLRSILMSNRFRK